ncbi:cell division control CDC36 [Fusarium acutatum]|uniref:Cell division control CDC36 n=1 Tax=Fusarium acutatum TaxID=78861 RepID=A0A8H4JGK4_9HYPO|nr:cell division control CDC36 [Fusarium acutatum]
MAGAGPQNAARQLGGNVSFAQSLSGSQPATSLDLSEFPSLSNNAQMSNPNQSSMWSTAGSRNLGGPSPRNQATPQQGGQDDMFSPTSSRGQGGFRFGNQGNIGQQTQSSSVDDFPPLNQTSNGEMGSDRTASLMSSLGFSSQAAGAGPSASNRGNGLLNALSANSRANEARSPPGIGAPGSSRPQDGKPPGLEEPRQKSSKEDAVPDDASNAADYNNADYSATNYVAQAMQKRLDTEDVIDPLEGMPASDKWGLKGLTTLMNNYPDYHAMVVGMDPNSLGLDINSQELFSTQIYSLFDDAPPRPVLSNGRFRLPDCYNVTNVQPIESKIQSFNEETLFWIFYSCTADVKQQMAAVELHSRNWRWHKKHQIWLTKDEHMTPQILSPNHERGYYVVWDTNSWRKERKELTLHYGDLDTTLGQAQVVP